MQVDIKKLPKSEVEISVSLAWDEWKGAFAHATEEVAKSVKVQGFRAGKAPRNLIEQKVGKGAILAEATEHALHDSYEKVLGEHHIDAIGRPKAEIKKSDEGGDFEYVITTAVMPELSLSDWEKGVKKANADAEKKEVTIDEKDIDKELRTVAESRAKFVTVNREARSGDGVEIDFRVLQDGVPIENGVSRGHHMILGKGTFIPGFEEAILGMHALEEKSFDLTFPAEYHAAHLAGKPARFEVTMKAVEEREIPPVDDAFAVSLGKFENLEALKKNIREGMLEEKRSALREERRGNIIEALVEASKAEIPDILLAEERGKMLAEFEAQLSQMNTSLDDFLVKSKKTREELEKDWTPQANRRVLSALALEKIALDRELEPSAADIEAEMNRVLQYYRSTKQAEKDIDLERLHQYSHGRLRNEKVLEFLEGLK
ncbi:MAG: trigger factor [Candidatus Moraniibacteriota bacterium]|nr:MAG: trigger factor [Candidatus Moranbacteria bacterium]